jgi:choline dehydrogenase-like flavoprotein
MVDKVLIEDGRATAVLYAKGGQIHTVAARREVVISAGAVC